MRRPTRSPIPPPSTVIPSLTAFIARKERRRAVAPARAAALAVASLLIALAPGSLGCAGRAADAGAGAADGGGRPVAVRIAPVEREAHGTRIEVAGVVASESEIPLSFKIGGLVAELAVDEGDGVRRGELLGRLELDEIDGRLEQARAALEQARRDLERVRDLHRDGAATTEELEKTETAVRVAASALDIASFDHRHATIRSPVTGWVLQRGAEPGQLVGPGDPVLVIGSAESGWVVRAGLADRDVVRIARGDLATVELAALPDLEIAARVVRIAESADPATGTFAVELRLAPDPAIARSLKSGFVARATLAAGTGGDLPSVPVEALVRADGREGLVYGVDPASGRFWPVAIDIEGFAGERLTARGGLDEVSWVITEGADRLRHDSRLDIRDAPPPAGVADEPVAQATAPTATATEARPSAAASQEDGR